VIPPSAASWRIGDPIRVPRRLTFDTFVDLGRKLREERNAPGSEPVVIDWRDVEWTGLPEVVSVLIASSALRRTRRVEWRFTDALHPAEGNDERRFAAELAAGTARVEAAAAKVQVLREKLRRHELYPNERRTEIERLRQSLPSAAHAWLDAETEPFKSADMLGYLNRYQILERAEDAGIEVVPERRALPHSRLAKASETASMSLRRLHSTTAVGSLVDQLSDAKHLSEILGRYAQVDLVRRGAFANILVRELGNNVSDHANAREGWLCTRVVRSADKHVVDRSDPAQQGFAAENVSYFEITVCDDGDGLITELRSVLDDDRRDLALKKRYPAWRAGEASKVELIDYAFDRFSSRRQKPERLILDTANGERNGVASGLYWIWNLVRSHHGVLVIRTADACAWYDFFRHKYQDPVPLPPSLEVPAVGTMIRVCLPIAEPEETAQESTHRTSKVKVAAPPPRPPNIPTAGRPPDFHYTWAADLSRVKLNAAPSDEPQMDLPWVAGHEAFINDLLAQHARTQDGDILIIDLIGMRRPWEKATVVPLCRFLTETNYTSPVATAATILWNVPESMEDVFAQAIAADAAIYRDLKDVRRFAMLVTDSGRMRIFSGWAEAERALSKFNGDSDELRLADLDVDELSADDRARFIHALRENRHIFEFFEERELVKLRPWPAIVRGEVWQKTSAWFETNLDDESRITFHAPPNSYFRLPSSDLLTTVFFHFRRFFADHEAFHRVAWMILQTFTWLAKKHAGIDTIVAVSRPAAALAGRIAHLYEAQTHVRPRVMAADHVEALRTMASAESKPLGNTVFVMTTLGTGTMAEQIANVLSEKQATWVGTLVCVDARSDVGKAGSERLDLDVEVPVTAELSTGPVYPLAIREVRKYTLAQIEDAQVISVDPVNACPVERAQMSNRPRSLWEFVQNDEQAVHAGHFHFGDYHHYAYYIDVMRLIDSGSGLFDEIVKCIREDAGQRSFDPDHAVVFYPPDERSPGRHIGHLVQQEIGAKYEFALYRDEFAGEWRFSPYALHGLPLDGADVILVDAESNTAETMTGLLHAATMGSPKSIRAYIGVERLPPHKARLFEGLLKLKECDDVRIVFASRLNIPVFSPAACPICRLRRDLDRVADKRLLLSIIVPSIVDTLKPQQAGRQSADFFWPCDDTLLAAQIREALETCEYDYAAEKATEEFLAPALNRNLDSLLTVAFVACIEPGLIRARVLAAQSAKLLERCLEAMAHCEGRHLVTLASFAMYLTLFSDSIEIAKSEERLIRSAVEALFKRPEPSITPHAVGQFIALILAEKLSETVIPSRARTADLWLRAFRDFDRVSAEKTLPGPAQLALRFAALYASEAATQLIHPSDADTIHHEMTLYELFNEVASKIHHHAARNSIHFVERISEAVESQTWNPEGLYGPVGMLLVCINQLQELRGRLLDTERKAKVEALQSSVIAPNWNTAGIERALSDTGRALLDLAELLFTGGEDAVERTSAIAKVLTTSIPALSTALKPAFEDLTPVAWKTVEGQWQEHIESMKDRLPDNFEATRGSVDRDQLVFFPKALLQRFVENATRNLRTSATRGMSFAQVQRLAAGVRMRYDDAAGDQRYLLVQVFDNGPELGRKDLSGPTGTGYGLQDIAAMATEYGAEVSIVSDTTETVVTLKLLGHRKPRRPLARGRK
jgi:hypothetical protein